jgi:hypothetical protein
MVKVKRILIGVLAFGLLAGCQNVEESENAVKESEKQVEVVKVEEEKPVPVVESKVESYVKLLGTLGERYHQLNVNLHEHYQKAEDNPALALDDEWVDRLTELKNEAFDILAQYEQTRYNGDVPEEFAEIHKYNEEAYLLTHRSIERFMEAVETGDRNLMRDSALDRMASNAKTEKATELMQEMIDAHKQ